MMKCTTAIIEKSKELNLSDKDKKEVMQILHDLQDLNEGQRVFFMFSFNAILKELFQAKTPNHRGNTASKCLPFTAQSNHQNHKYAVFISRCAKG